MNPQDPLAGLHPLREPEVIGWWPLAPGWWVLSLAVIVSTLAIAYWLYRRHRANAYRRAALRQLQQLQTQYQGDGNNSEFVTRVNALLKRVALTAYPDDDIAARHGASWQSFLDQQLPPDQSFPDDFATAAYRKECPELDAGQLQRAARQWIKHHRRAA